MKESQTLVERRALTALSHLGDVEQQDVNAYISDQITEAKKMSNVKKVLTQSIEGMIVFSVIVGFVVGISILFNGCADSNALHRVKEELHEAKKTESELSQTITECESELQLVEDIKKWCLRSGE